MNSSSSYVHDGIKNERTNIKLCFRYKHFGFTPQKCAIFPDFFIQNFSSAYYTQEINKNSFSSHVHHGIRDGKKEIKLYLWDKLILNTKFRFILICAIFQILSSKVNVCVLYRTTIDELFSKPMCNTIYGMAGPKLSYGFGTN